MRTDVWEHPCVCRPSAKKKKKKRATGRHSSVRSTWRKTAWKTFSISFLPHNHGISDLTFGSKIYHPKQRIPPTSEIRKGLTEETQDRFTLALSAAYLLKKNRNKIKKRKENAKNISANFHPQALQTGLVQTDYEAVPKKVSQSSKTLQQFSHYLRDKCEVFCLQILVSESDGVLHAAVVKKHSGCLKMTLCAKLARMLINRFPARNSNFSHLKPESALASTLELHFLGVTWPAGHVLCFHSVYASFFNDITLEEKRRSVQEGRIRFFSLWFFLLKKSDTKQHHKRAQQSSISGCYHSHHVDVVFVVTWTEQNFFSLIISRYQLFSAARSPFLIPRPAGADIWIIKPALSWRRLSN